MRRTLIAAALLLLLPCLVLAQEPEESVLDWWVNNAAIDLAVPTSPAFAVLGVTPETVVRPEGPRNLAVGLLSGVDPRGNLQTGLAFDTAPYLLLAGDEVTLRQYREDDYVGYVVRLLGRTQVSLATAKGATDDDDATRLGLGLRLTLWDEGDPRLDDALLACFGERWAESKAEREAWQDRVTELTVEIDLLEQTGGDEERLAELRQQLEQLQAEGAALETELKEDVRGCRSDPAIRGSLWNNSAWSVGLAPTWTAEDGAIDELGWSGVGLWTTFGYGFENVPGLEDSAEILLHGRIRTDEEVPDEAGNFFEQDSFTLGTQLRVAGPDIGTATLGGPDLSFIVDLAYIDNDRKGRDDEELFRYGIGAEYQVSSDVYLQLSLGSESGGDDDESFLLGNLKWSFASEPMLAGAIRQ